jgi:5'-phosphate synthase pdxT subunit
MDIAAHRNFYGSQLDSFTTSLEVKGFREPIEAQFIRAPLLSPLEPTQGRPVPGVESSLPGQPVFISQGHLWACSFHVELVESLALHERFVRLMGTAQPQQTASL